MNRVQSFRTSFIFFLFCLAYAVVLINIYIIQIMHRDFYLRLGHQQYTFTHTQKPPRAAIYDRNGNPLAINKESFCAFCVPKKLENPHELTAFLQIHFPQAAQRLQSHADSQFMYIKRKLTHEQQSLIEQAMLPDIKLLAEPSRYYPLACAVPLVGLTDIDNSGLFGVELLHNEQLGGTPTTYNIERDARSGCFYFTKQTQVPGNEGTPITLTIDSDLQFLAHQAVKEKVQFFQAEEGAAIIMEPYTGEILAMVHYPDVDLNNLQELPQEYCKAKAITDVHELGSVMKVFVALAALEEEVITFDEPIDCLDSKSTLLNGIKVNTWKAHGVLPFNEVIQVSNNIGIAKVAQRLGPRLYDHYRLCGFGHKTGLGFPGEQPGTITHPKQWSKQSLISLSFGYEISASLLQLARAFSMIANGGHLREPALVMRTAPVVSEQLYKDQTLETLQTILEQTVTKGTARKAAVQGYRVMGKTGTANMLIDGIYSPNNNVFTFAGIVQKDAYKRVIVAWVKNAASKNLYASQVAVPLFERIMEQLILHDRVY